MGRPPYAFTASHQRLSDLADRALELPEGLRLEFTLSKYDTPEATLFAAKRFQSNFCSMRTKDRQRGQRHKGENPQGLDATTTGRYDFLACVRTPIEDGWEVRLVRAALIDFNVPVIDNATGAEIEDFSGTRGLSDALGRLIMDELASARQAKRPPINPLTPTQMSWWQANDPQIMVTMMEGLAATVFPPPSTAAPPFQGDAVYDAVADFLAGPKKA